MLQDVLLFIYFYLFLPADGACAGDAAGAAGRDGIPLMLDNFASRIVSVVCCIYIFVCVCVKIAVRSGCRERV